jgi:predicted DNA-binding transcriptional regulator AlpA
VSASPKTINPSALAALVKFDELPDSANVRLPVLTGLYGVSAPTIWRWVKSGWLPAPRKLGPNTTAWSVGELRRHHVSQAAEAA